MSFLLDGLHEDVNLVKEKQWVETLEADGANDAKDADEAWGRHLKRNNSRVVDLFGGQLRSHVTCNVCGKESVTFDPMTSISLPLPGGPGCLVLLSLRLSPPRWLSPSKDNIFARPPQAPLRGPSSLCSCGSTKG